LICCEDGALLDQVIDHGILHAPLQTQDSLLDCTNGAEVLLRLRQEVHQPKLFPFDLTANIVYPGVELPADGIKIPFLLLRQMQRLIRENVAARLIPSHPTGRRIIQIGPQKRDV
jgi:hypothetical protein